MAGEWKAITVGDQTVDCHLNGFDTFPTVMFQDGASSQERRVLLGSKSPLVNVQYLNLTAMGSIDFDVLRGLESLKVLRIVRSGIQKINPLVFRDWELRKVELIDNRALMQAAFTGAKIDHLVIRGCEEGYSVLAGDFTNAQIESLQIEGVFEVKARAFAGLKAGDVTLSSLMLDLPARAFEGLRVSKGAEEDGESGTLRLTSIVMLNIQPWAFAGLKADSLVIDCTGIERITRAAFFGADVVDMRICSNRDLEGIETGAFFGAVVRGSLTIAENGKLKRLSPEAFSGMAPDLAPEIRANHSDLESSSPLPVLCRSLDEATARYRPQTAFAQFAELCIPPYQFSVEKLSEDGRCLREPSDPDEIAAAFGALTHADQELVQSYLEEAGENNPYPYSTAVRLAIAQKYRELSSERRLKVFERAAGLVARFARGRRELTPMQCKQLAFSNVYLLLDAMAFLSK